MTKSHFVLLVAFALVTCKPKDIAPTAVAQFFIDANRQSGIQGSSIGVVESCDGFTISVIDFANTLPVHNLRIHLNPSGQLVSINLRTKEGKRYETRLFNPSDAVSIFEYAYNKTEKRISFSLNGKLSSTTLNDSINISGRFDNLPVKLSECNRMISKLSGEVQGVAKPFIVETLSGSSSIRTAFDGAATNTYFQNFLLTNSFNLQFESLVSFKNLAVGSYKIGAPNAIQVSLKEYKGLSDPNTLNTYISKDWRDFSLDGSLTISRQYTINGNAYTEGTINFQANNTIDNVRYVLNRGAFTLVNLD